MKQFLLWLIALSTGWTIPGFASTKNDLFQINQKIATTKAVLSKYQNERSTYLKNLELAETAFNEAEAHIQAIEKTLEKQLHYLKKLKLNQKIYQTQLLKQQNKLSAEIRYAYQLSREPYLKLILSQNDAQTIRRFLVYYRYLTQMQVAAIQHLQTILTKLKTNKTNTTIQTKILQQLQLQQDKEKKRLKKLTQQRHQIISNLDNEIQRKNQGLLTLLNNKRQLEQTLKQLKKQNYLEKNQAFAQWKGKLPWPTQGTLLPYFGTPIDQSELKWDGILIKAPEKQPVRAIAAGKVAFAKWLPGYGLLLIINHGDGYMSLYGHNYNIYSKPGDAVKKGDLVAAVGKSGGYKEPALYFGIRHHAKPLNPIDWFTRRR